MTAPTDATRVDAMPIPQILALPAIVPAWPTASAALGGSPAGWGRRSTYQALKDGTFAVPAFPQGGHKNVCRRADILAYLGLNGDDPAAPTAGPLASSTPTRTSSH